MKRIILSVCLGLYSLMAISQTDVVQFLKGGKADANKLAQAYLEPYAFALGDGLNNGWYNTAKTHKLLGFDFTVTVSAIQIPKESQTFDLNTLGLKNMLVTSGSSIAPTVAGKNQAGPKILVKDDKGNSIASFNSPNGVGLDIVPVPMVQVGFGLLPHTDVIARYVPDVKYDNGGDQMKVGLWGIGCKHNFMEWIPVLKRLPFDASIFGSYSEVNAQSELSFTPQDYSEAAGATITFTNSDDQLLQIKTKTSKFGLIVSKKLSILTVWAGIGHSSSKSNVDMLGRYPVITTVQGGGLSITNEDALVDPIALNFKSSNVSMDAGVRLKLAFFSLFGSINKAQYTSYNAGISFGMR